MNPTQTTTWMTPDAYARSLNGLTINLLVHNMTRMLEFQRYVLDVETVYEDSDFAVFRGYGAQWMIHADHTYRNHPLFKLLPRYNPRGGLIELRVHGCDPDRVETQARERGYEVVQETCDRPHGLREVYVRDSEGYLWVPDQPTDFGNP